MDEMMPETNPETMPETNEEEPTTPGMGEETEKEDEVTGTETL